MALPRRARAGVPLHGLARRHRARCGAAGARQLHDGPRRVLHDPPPARRPRLLGPRRGRAHTRRAQSERARRGGPPHRGLARRGPRARGGDAAGRRAAQRHPRPRPAARVTSDRVALLGDAAHAVPPDLGQGACQAIEDAVVLAVSLRDHSVPEALAAYDAARRPRAAYVTKQARGKAAADTSSAWWLHALLAVTVPLLPASVIRRQAAPLWDWTPPVL
ncbi:FAD-dependent monooxygenase [Amycolatopsis carbonis]|uniref:FAD-dependent monooxygenase n=1 Tax=Amycolatopsis carbonis TaxID=715471 RepID=UPI003341957B